MFDLQRFTEDVNNEAKEYDDVLDGADETNAESSPIPAELEGIPENIAREIMTQAAQNKADSESVENKAAETPTEDVNYSGAKGYGQRHDSIFAL